MGQVEDRSRDGSVVGVCPQGQSRRSAPAALLSAAVAIGGIAVACASTGKGAGTPSQGHETASETLHFDGTKAYALLKAQCDFGPRYPGSEAHKKTRDWIVAQAKQYTDKVETQEFTHEWSVTKSKVTMWNVVATMDVGAKTTVLLLAHWDTRPTADMEWDAEKQKKPIVGANDGASGVSVLLELMRAFKQTPPPVNVTFLFTDGEDLGPEINEMFLGATHFAKNMKRGAYSFGILLDMVGDKDLEIPIESYSQYYARSVVERFYRNAALLGYSKQFPRQAQGQVLDDHLPLNEAGLPTMDLIDFQYPYWHTLDDTPDKCSAESLAIVGRAVESFLRKERGS